ncbi:SEC-C domain-containing protein [bacterium]|nr:SEC-C domain-containing protein [bacterium]
MLDRINGEILEICFKAQLQVQAPEDMRVRSRQPMEMSAVHDSASGMGFAGQQEDGQESPVPQRRVTVQPVKVEHKVGRNEPCPCGSGKKYKQCCGR